MDYRSTVHASTNKTPASLLFGREIRTDIPAYHVKLQDKEVRERLQIQTEDAELL